MRDRLYVGGMEGAGKHAELKRRGVTHILCMANYHNDAHKIDDMSFAYMIVGAHDTPTYDIARHFDDIHAFISHGRSIGGVYVHCMAGISRAATAILVHLMRVIREQKSGPRVLFVYQLLHDYIYD